MRRKLIILFFVLAGYISLYAQQKKIIFRSISSVEYLIGQNEDAPGFQTVNGIAYKNYFSGIGVGADYYHYNSYPLFFDQRIYIGKKRSLFGYGNLGYNFNNKKNKPGDGVYYYTSYYFTGGIYTDVGVGVRIHLKGTKSFITFSGGFAYKELHSKTTTVMECFTTPCPVDYNHYQYANGRVALKAGVDF